MRDDGRRGRPSGDELQGDWPRERLIQMDARFCARLDRAFARGEERLGENPEFLRTMTMLACGACSPSPMHGSLSSRSPAPRFRRRPPGLLGVQLSRARHAERPKVNK